jgi:uncharacterized protein with HEPN domain
MSYPRDLDWIEDITKAIRFVLEYAATVNEDIFSVDHAVQNVILREITVIGEAARRLSEDFVRTHPEIPVADMISMRNALVHDYDDIRLPWVWATVKNDLPGLLTILESRFP